MASATSLRQYCQNSTSPAASRACSASSGLPHTSAIWPSDHALMRGTSASGTPRMSRITSNGSSAANSAARSTDGRATDGKATDDRATDSEATDGGAIAGEATEAGTDG